MKYGYSEGQKFLYILDKEIRFAKITQLTERNQEPAYYCQIYDGKTQPLVIFVFYERQINVMTKINRITALL